LLSALSQQVQSHRTLLGRIGEALERRLARYTRNGLSLRAHHDLERPAPARHLGREDLPDRREADQGGHASRRTPGPALAHARKVVRRHSARAHHLMGYAKARGSLNEISGSAARDRCRVGGPLAPKAPIMPTASPCAWSTASRCLYAPA